MKKITTRLATVVVAVGLTLGVAATTAAPAQAMTDTSWGRIAPVQQHSVTY